MDYYSYIKKINLLNIAILTLILSASTYAQNTLPITLSEAKTKAKENNTKLKISQQDYVIAKSNYEQTRAVLLPKINISNTSIATNNPLNSFGFKLLQESVSASDFNPDILNNPGQTENFNTKIDVQQPLLNVDGWKARKAANLQMQAADFQKERSAEYLELEVEKTYMELQLAYKAAEVTRKALETAGENQKIAKNSFDQGIIQNADLLNVEVRVTEVQNQLQYAESNVQNVSDYLAFLLGVENSETFIPEKELSITTSDVDMNSNLNTERNDIKAFAYNVDAQEQMMKTSKLSFIPRANAFGSYEWNDEQFMGFSAKNYIVGLQFSWDLFNGGKNIGKIHYEKAQLEKANLSKENYIANSKIELNKAKRQLKDARNNVTLSKLALEQSEESLRIMTNRFEQGLEKTNDLLFVETQFQQKELAYYQAVFKYNYALAYLNFLNK